MWLLTWLLLQSDYRAKHSTETALLKVQNDIVLSFDIVSFVVVLVLLDLSAAFDMVDHGFFYYVYVICMEFLIMRLSGLGLTYPIETNKY